MLIRTIVWLIVIIKIFSMIAIADPNAFIAGEHFKILRNVDLQQQASKLLPKETVASKPQVMIFFNYGCYGCFLVNKDFTKWMLANKKIDVSYYPVAFNDMWENLAKFYYVNKELQPDDDNEEIFIGLHRDRKRLWLEAEMINFYAKKNIHNEDFLKIYHSFDVERKVKKSMDIAKIYGVHVTPNVIVTVKNNSYMVNFTMVQNIETLFKVIDYLIKEHPKA